MKYVLKATAQTTMAVSHAPLPAGTAYELDGTFELIDLNAMITRGRRDITAYEVDGDSMLPSIVPGSLVFVDPERVPKSGDVVCLCHNGKNSVKRIEIKTNGLYLVSSNANYPKTKVTAEDTVFILGVVLGSLQMF